MLQDSLKGLLMIQFSKESDGKTDGYGSLEKKQNILWLWRHHDIKMWMYSFQLAGGLVPGTSREMQIRLESLDY